MSTQPIDEFRTPFALDADNKQFPGPGRIWCIRIMLPGHSDPDLRTATAFPMDGIVEEILENIPGLAAVEQLTAPGTIQQEHCLIGYSNDRNHERSIEDALGNRGKPVTAYGEGSSGTPSTKGRKPSSIAKKMHEIVKSGIPENISTQLTEVDLTPLGILPRPTSRVLLAENMRLTRIDTVGQSAVVDLVRTLNARRVPYLHGTLLTRAGSKGTHNYLVPLQA